MGGLGSEAWGFQGLEFEVLEGSWLDVIPLFFGFVLVWVGLALDLRL